MESADVMRRVVEIREGADIERAVSWPKRQTGETETKSMRSFRSKDVL
jgi:hypothetical protein